MLTVMTLTSDGNDLRIERGFDAFDVRGVALYGLAEIEVSERDILHGAAYAAAELPEPEEGLAPPGAYTCC